MLTYLDRINTGATSQSQSRSAHVYRPVGSRLRRYQRLRWMMWERFGSRRFLQTYLINCFVHHQQRCFLCVISEQIWCIGNISVLACTFRLHGLGMVDGLCIRCLYEMCMPVGLAQSQSRWMTFVVTVYVQLSWVFAVAGFICYFGSVVWYISELKAWIIILIRCLA